jgi:hypothetical protein
MGCELWVGGVDVGGFNLTSSPSSTHYPQLTPTLDEITLSTVTSRVIQLSAAQHISRSAEFALH